jgi:hypothetical protein
MKVQSESRQIRPGGFRGRMRTAFRYLNSLLTGKFTGNFRPLPPYYKRPFLARLLDVIWKVILGHRLRMSEIIPITGRRPANAIDAIGPISDIGWTAIERLLTLVWRTPQYRQ